LTKSLAADELKAFLEVFFNRFMARGEPVPPEIHPLNGGDDGVSTRVALWFSVNSTAIASESSPSQELLNYGLNLSCVIDDGWRAC
jgi:hypothetical protein